MRIYPQSRTVATRIDIPQIHEAHFLRMALECEAARNLALSPDHALMTRARSIIRMQEALPEQEVAAPCLPCGAGYMIAETSHSARPSRAHR